jgi:hypothetical protein
MGHFSFLDTPTFAKMPTKPKAAQLPSVGAFPAKVGWLVLAEAAKVGFAHNPIS